MFAWSISRCYSATRAGHRTHYDTLGVNPKATFAEIKSAYYKLSMQHHPDRQEGNRKTFEEITNAYKVVGDVQSRQLYDQGAFQDSSPIPNQRNYYSHAGPQHRRPEAPSGRTPIYDFDMWSRLHYGKTLERRNIAKLKYETKVDQLNLKRRDAIKENVNVSIISTIVFLGIIVYAYNASQDNFDNPQKGSK